MNAPLAPASLSELAEAVRSTPRLLAVGAGTKPRLSASDVAKLSISRLQGIVEYEPSEFTFTALAGTPIRAIAAALAERGQYLPFDPLWVEAGATLGGTVAAGVSGPGRFRFGSLRDFILGVKFVDGAGRLLRMGSKVVKNAAGFDLPKFFVGSLGRFGVLTELTFKVFPAPVSTLTLRLGVTGTQSATEILCQASIARWELDALEFFPDDQAIVLRLAGPPAALEQIAREILTRWPGEMLAPGQASALWAEMREFKWAHAEGPLLKVPLTPAALVGLGEAVASLADARWQVGGGGNVAFISLPNAAQIPQFNDNLNRLALPALTLRGDAPLWCGARNTSRLETDLKLALDPENRFPSLDE